jgi:chorismate synthase
LASNSFGTLFRMTTWGESHGPAIGVVIDGCPAGLELLESDIAEALAQRAPGNSPYTSPRKEPDVPQILSGVFEGKTTGTPISILVWNKDADSSKYDSIKHLLRPGHANYTYLQKYGIFDHRGGGRASARETVGRVAAGAIASKLLALQGIEISASIYEVAGIRSDSETAIANAIEQAKANGDSVGGIVEFSAMGVPAGWGDPIYEKIEANLAKAMLSLPAAKGFEIGNGFAAARALGSTNNDAFVIEAGKIRTRTNHAGGVLAGITNGMPLIGRVALKPPSSIMKATETITTEGKKDSFILPEGSRHDPCVVIRAVPVVKAMVALVLIDAYLLNGPGPQIKI